MKDKKRKEIDSVIERFCEATGKHRTTSTYKSHGNPRIVWRVNGELVQMIGKWEELLDKSSVVTSPYNEVATFGLLRALDAAGELSLPEEAFKGDIILLCDEDDSKWGKDVMEQREAFVASAPNNIMDLYRMREEGIITDEIVELPMNVDETRIVWQGDDGTNELLNEYKKYCCVSEIATELQYEFNDFTKRSNHSVFKRPGDKSCRPFPFRIAWDFLSALSMGIVDVSDITTCLDGFSIRKDILWDLCDMGCAWRQIPELALMYEKATAVIALWQYAMNQEGLYVKTSIDETTSGTLASRLARIGEFAGVDELLRTYMDGVPVSDITA